MLPPSFYCKENVLRARYVHLSVAVTAAACCCSLIVATTADLRCLRQAEDALEHARQRSARLGEEATRAERRVPAFSVLPEGIEPLAVQMANWARASGLRVEGLSPEGSSAVSEVKLEDASLGQWKVDKVSVRMSGNFEQAMDVLHKLCYVQMPVQLESFSLQAPSSAADGSITIQLLLTVYEKKRGQG